MKESAALSNIKEIYDLLIRDEHTKGWSLYSLVRNIVDIYNELSSEKQKEARGLFLNGLGSGNKVEVNVSANIIARIKVPEAESLLIRLIEEKVVREDRWLISDLIQALGNIESKNALTILKQFAERCDRGAESAFAGSLDAVIAIAKVSLDSAFPYFLKTLRYDLNYSNSDEKLSRGQSLIQYLLHKFTNILEEEEVSKLAVKILKTNKDEKEFIIRTIKIMLDEDKFKESLLKNFDRIKMQFLLSQLQ